MGVNEGRQGSAWAAIRSFVRGLFIAPAAREPAPTVHQVAIAENAVLDAYVDAMPSPQNAVDCVPGWNHAMPPEAGATAGLSALYDDDRLKWCIRQFGPIENCRILELGPLEGMHTYMLHKHDPAEIVSVEANRLAFMKCLISKELLRLTKARFLLGDFEKLLEQSPDRYDLIVASGVLYHMRNPVRLLELMSARTDSIYIWTHYFSDVAMPDGDSRRGAFSGDIITIPFQETGIRLHKRSYHEAWRSKSFCGGLHDVHFWMEQDQLIEVVKRLGFGDIRVAHDTPAHEAGPSMSVFAKRTPSCTS